MKKKQMKKNQQLLQNQPPRRPEGRLNVPFWSLSSLRDGPQREKAKHSDCSLVRVTHFQTCGCRYHNRAMKISGQGGAMKSPAAWDKAQGRRGLHRRSTDQWRLLSSHVLGLKCNHRGLMTILFNDCIVVQISLKCPTQTFVEYLLSSESQFCLVLFFFGVLWLSEGKWYPAWA